MKTAALFFLLAANTIASAGPVLAPPAPTSDNPCLTEKTDTCQARAPKAADAPAIQVNASSYRGPRGVPDAMLDGPNPELVPKKKSSPHKEASVSVGVMKF